LVTELDHLRAEEWNAYQATVVRPNTDPHRKQGEYAVASRRRRKEEDPYHRLKSAVFHVYFILQWLTAPRSTISCA